MAENRGPSTHYNALLTAAHFIGEQCLDVNREFVKCKDADENPKRCLEEGTKATACALKVLREAESKCMDSFAAFQICLRDHTRQFEYCVKEEAAFNACMRG